MPRKATPLTDSAIKVAKPKDSPYKLTDGQGLYLEVTPNGSKLWRLKYRFDGKEKRLALGAYPAVPLQQARQRRTEARKQVKKRLESRFKDAKDPLKLVIVRDMWLTGFDAPCCHTMYIDKPMKGHNLMQAIARVNRVFKNKPGGLVVDYIGIANELKAALKTYSDAKGKGDPTHDSLLKHWLC